MLGSLGCMLEFVGCSSRSAQNRIGAVCAVLELKV